ncbi:hypothetical protein [Rhodanobacter sp. FW106-PBR-LB-2-11]|uniref:hypothetical protein n=1 Tax=Rhodanobacter sp. FW106-PBR-LB-2-11 TaxID=1524463 RepID=UPI0034E41B25
MVGAAYQHAMDAAHRQLAGLAQLPVGEVEQPAEAGRHEATAQAIPSPQRLGGTCLSVLRGG